MYQIVNVINITDTHFPATKPLGILRSSLLKTPRKGSQHIIPRSCGHFTRSELRKIPRKRDSEMSFMAEAIRRCFTRVLAKKTIRFI